MTNPLYLAAKKLDSVIRLQITLPTLLPQKLTSTDLVQLAHTVGFVTCAHTF